MTTFFVPTEVPADAAKQERVYAAFAALCGRAVLPMSERVFKMEWNHDGDSGPPRSGSRC